MTEVEWEDRHLRQFEFTTKNVLKRTLFWLVLFVVVALLTNTNQPITILKILLMVLLSLIGGLGQLAMQRYFLKKGHIHIPKYPKYTFLQKQKKSQKE